MERPSWGPHIPNVGVESAISTIDSTLADGMIGPTLLVQMRPQFYLSSYCGGLAKGRCLMCPKPIADRAEIVIRLIRKWARACHATKN